MPTKKTTTPAKPRPEGANNPSPTQATRHVGKKARMRKINEMQPLPTKETPPATPRPKGAKHPITVGRDLRQHLDGTNQTLKVGHANQSGVTLSGASKVLTNQICDANGKNCKNVSQLSTGTATYTA